MIAWLTEEDSILYPMVRDFEKNRDIKITKSGSYFNQFYKDLHTENGLFYLDNKWCLPFVLRTAAMKLLHELKE